MKTYGVLVEEILSRVVRVEAEDEEDAENKVREMYNKQEIVLGGDDMHGDVLIREENCE